MSNRNELHAKLCELLGSSHVYFQPPENVKLIFPCIIYNLDQFYVRHADGFGYHDRDRYSVTLISEDPDWLLVREMVKLPLCSFNRFFTSDNLNHWTYEIYI